MNQFNTANLFLSIYAFYDWYYDDTVLKNMKLTIGILSAIPSFFMCVKLLRLGYILPLFLINNVI